jgi:hypothetical protein
MYTELRSIHESNKSYHLNLTTPGLVWLESYGEGRMEAMAHVTMKIIKAEKDTTKMI